jgi:uncharacterized CHY-type Zn-finger protein
MERAVGGSVVRGVDVGGETRCRHYDGERDVVAIRFACCERYYPCFRCHAALADHDPSVWPVERFDRRAVLCGVCGTELRIDDYLGVTACPECEAAFNPGCRDHYDRYFAVAGGGGTSATHR